MQVPLIAYSTGERGLISQVLAPKFGGFLVYGTIEGQVVPGLPTLSSLRQVYQVEDIDADTKVFGLVSKPVSHSKGPILHNPTFRRVGYNALYVPMLVDDLKGFFNVYSSPDFAGFRYFICGFPSLMKCNKLNTSMVIACWLPQISKSFNKLVW